MLFLCTFVSKIVSYLKDILLRPKILNRCILAFLYIHKKGTGSCMLLGILVVIGAYGLTWLLLLRSIHIIKVIHKDDLDHGGDRCHNGERV